ncbi:hypothetical protein B0A49_06745 [Cryomyces minteri]|uniref:Protein arginine methyltransferase NDUFAF7 n=1 Tax=Cryomyces minteri TaxID=331657 RepID=A0A4V6WKV5_9PEZI|nr:hypothetical protein B0A49_06745 [Cryomyces minteri]
MRQCLTSPDGGYYTSRTEGRDQFGQKGDFVTSPEISQMFGELIGVWVVAEWMAQGRKSTGVYIMEVGPGRGTLMDDMLRTIRNFKPLASAIEAIYLVEASPSLRQAQHELLCGDAPLEETDIGFQSTSKYAPDLKIIWCEDVRFVPKDPSQTPFIVAHEFFDALPIHVFQSVAPSPHASTSPSQILTPTGPISNPAWQQQSQQQGNQWRELLVSPTAPPSAITTSSSTSASAVGDSKPEFELTLAKAATPHSLYLPETSDRYKALKGTEGATIEISPEALSYAADFAVRIGGSASQTPTSSPTSPTQPASTYRNRAPIPVAFSKPAPSGAALILDYGPTATIPTNSLRGIRAHAAVSPFAAPGAVDLSTDVDFMALALAALDASPAVEVHGPAEQAAWLAGMGIGERAAQLVKRALERDRGMPAGGEGQQREKEGGGAKADLTETVKRIETGWKRLVDRGPNGMGRLYKVMAIVPYVPLEKGKPRRRPVGFGGDVAG